MLALILQWFHPPSLPKEQENLLPFTLVAFLRALLSATNPYTSGTDHRSEVAAAGGFLLSKEMGELGSSASHLCIRQWNKPLTYTYLEENKDVKIVPASVLFGDRETGLRIIVRQLPENLF